MESRQRTRGKGVSPRPAALDCGVAWIARSGEEPRTASLSSGRTGRDMERKANHASAVRFDRQCGPGGLPRPAFYHETCSASRLPATVAQTASFPG